jgi:peptidoglycan/LPS O-acetylase OafA/YrhL
MKIKCVIVDDEKIAREVLAGYLKKYCPVVEIAGEAQHIGLIAALIASPYIIYTEDYYLSFVFNRLLSAMLSAKIIEGAAGGYKNFVGKVLQWKPIVAFGRMSYGIYLYHLLVPVAFWRLYNSVMHFGRNHYPSFFEQHKAGVSTFETVISSGAVCLIMYFTFTLLMAMFSARFIEQPMSKLKVPYYFNFKKIPLFQKFNLRLHNKG